MKKVGIRLLFLVVIFSFLLVFVSAEGDLISPVDAWADSEYSDEYAVSNVYDGDLGSAWASENLPEYPVNLYLDFGESVNINAVDVNVHSYYLPIHFNFYGSSDNIDYSMILADEVADEEYLRASFGENIGLRYLRVEEVSAERETFDFIYEVRGVLGEGEAVEVEDLKKQLKGGEVDCDKYLICGAALTCCDGLLYPSTCCDENCDEPIDECGAEEVDCDKYLICGAALTCCDGLLYPSTCCDENCDEPIDECGDILAGDLDYIIVENFGSLEYDEKESILESDDIVFDDMSFVGGERGAYSSGGISAIVSIVEYSENISFVDFNNFVNSFDSDEVEIDYDEVEDELASVEDGQVLFVMIEDERGVGFVFWTSGKYFVSFEFNIGDYSYDDESLFEAWIGYLTKYKTSLVIDTGIFECFNSWECPSSFERTCEGDGYVETSQYSDCVNSRCVAGEVEVSWTVYCENGCNEESGECNGYPVRELDGCDDVTGFIKDPYSFRDESGVAWKLNYNYSYLNEDIYVGTGNNNEDIYVGTGNNNYPVDIYYASFYYDSDRSDDSYFGGWMSFSYEMYAFESDSSSDVINDILDERVSNGLCSPIVKEDRVYYLCDSSALYEMSEFDDYYDSYSNSGSGSILWVSGSNLFVYHVDYRSYQNYYDYYGYNDDDNERYYYELTQRQLRLIEKSQYRALDFLSGLADNEAEWVSSSDFYYTSPWALRQNTIIDMGMCLSDSPVGEGVCSPYWMCSVEPAICPEYGYQTKKCVDVNGCFDTEESQDSCNPGICSGCMMSKWIGFGWRELDTKCMPYGARFEFSELLRNEDEIEGGVYEESFRTTEIEILDDYRARISTTTSSVAGLSILVIGNVQEYMVYEGNLFEIEGMQFYAKDVIYDESMDGNGQIIITVEEEYNAYCDYDGKIKEQRVKDYNGNWAKCQNNFECHSNVCSGGECIEIVDLIQEASGLRGLGVRVLCKLADLFAIQEYDECIFDNLGENA